MANDVMGRTSTSGRVRDTSIEAIRAALAAAPPGLAQIEAIRRAGALMNPGGGSLETTAAVQALHLICLSQQGEIDYLREQIQYLLNRLSAR